VAVTAETASHCQKKETETAETSHASILLEVQFFLGGGVGMECCQLL